MSRFRNGDFFSFKIADGQYLAGKILLDIKRQCVTPKLIKPESPLWIFNGCILVEVYKDIFPVPTFTSSETLIPGVFVDKGALKEREWITAQHEEVDPYRVEFPEFLIPASEVYFGRGEIQLPLPFESSDLDRVNVLPTLKSSFALPDICLYYLGLKHLIRHQYGEKMNLSHSDLRFSPYRSEVYGLLGEDERQSYSEMSHRHGLEISRFYK